MTVVLASAGTVIPNFGHDAGEPAPDREQMGRELQRILDEKTNPWGITVQSVEIRDVQIPQALEEVVEIGNGVEHAVIAVVVRPIVGFIEGYEHHARLDHLHVFERHLSGDVVVTRFVPGDSRELTSSRIARMP